jgi:hypothetical protein
VSHPTPHPLHTSRLYSKHPKDQRSLAWRLVRNMYRVDEHFAGVITENASYTAKMRSRFDVCQAYRSGLGLRNTSPNSRYSITIQCAVIYKMREPEGYSHPPSPLFLSYYFLAFNSISASFGRSARLLYQFFRSSKHLVQQTCVPTSLPLRSAYWLRQSMSPPAQCPVRSPKGV